MKILLRSSIIGRRLLMKSNPNTKSNNLIIRCLTQKGYEENYNVYRQHIMKALIGTSVVTLIAYTAYNDQRHQVHAKEIPQETSNNAGNFKEGLPLYTLEEVSKHAAKIDGVWVTFKEGVYDITEFIENHPGGEQILLAAGSSVEPFWLLYGVHKDPNILNLLESFRIGNLSKKDSKKLIEDMTDPYGNDPKRHAALKPASIKPFNAEPPLSLLVDLPITPNELFYVRNHLPVPEIDEESYELEIEIEGIKKVMIFTLEELKKFPKKTITATIMCAGNRRSEMVKIKPVKGLNWGPAAVGNAQWTGVPLREILKIAGLTENDVENYKHVQFEGLDLDPTGTSYGASIPIWKAVDQRGDVILAYEMNGVPIPRDHGYPIRVIVPGTVGARNVKWLGKVTVAKVESNSHWQQNDYKGFSPSTDWDTVDFTKSPAIQELPVISAICKPSSGEEIKLENGELFVKGYAWSGNGQKIVRVDVTIDGGKTWVPANFEYQDAAEPPQHWAWTVWSLKIPIKDNNPGDEVEIWAKAVDSCYNTQPESFENIWNLRGVLSNAYHRVLINVIKS